MDTVEQLQGGSVTLWFNEGDISNWKEDTLTYTEGDNSVTVSGVGVENIIIKFSYGDNDPTLAFLDGEVQYGYLEGNGAFADYTIDKVFEGRNTGMLA